MAESIEIHSDGSHYVVKGDDVDELWRRIDNGADKWGVLDDLADDPDHPTYEVGAGDSGDVEEGRV